MLVSMVTMLPTMLSTMLPTILLTVSTMGLPTMFHHAPVHHAPLVHHAAPVHHAPAVVHHEQGPAAYNYGYAVADSYSGVNFGATEARDGYATTGSYNVLLPDGRT